MMMMMILMLMMLTITPMIMMIIITPRVRSYDTPRSRDKYSSMTLMDMIQVPSAAANSPQSVLSPMQPTRTHRMQGEELLDAELDLDTNMVPLRLIDLLEKGCPACLRSNQSSRAAISLMLLSAGCYPDEPPPPPISQHFASFLRACLNPTSSK
jgi:hypothetical protein